MRKTTVFISLVAKIMICVCLTVFASEKTDNIIRPDAQLDGVEVRDDDNQGNANAGDHDKIPDVSIDQDVDWSQDESEEDTNEESTDEVEEYVPTITEGSYEHEIGDCVFYTDNDIEQWIDDEVFDFYSMMEYFGWEKEPVVLPGNGYWCNPGSNVELSEGMVRLAGSRFVGVYHEAIGDLGGDSFYIAIFEWNGRRMTTTNGMEIPFELCELLLYTMECVDEEPPEYVLADLSNLDKYLPERIYIDTIYR